MLWLLVKFFVLVNGEECFAGGFTIGAVFAWAPPKETPIGGMTSLTTSLSNQNRQFNPCRYQRADKFNIKFSFPSNAFASDLPFTYTVACRRDIEIIFLKATDTLPFASCMRP